jgi:hypothetical protein
VCVYGWQDRPAVYYTFAQSQHNGCLATWVRQQAAELMHSDLRDGSCDLFSGGWLDYWYEILVDPSESGSPCSARQGELLIGQHHHGDDSERMFCSFVWLCPFERSRHGRLVAFKESAW